MELRSTSCMVLITGLLSAALALIGTPQTLQAATYPARAVRLIVPFAPGGATDIMARELARRFAADTGQTLIVDNRGGASGIIGTALAAKAAPDGYTLLFASSAQLAINPSLYASLPYDPVKDFEPVILIGATPNVIVATRSASFKSLADLVAQAKAHPGALAFGSPGVGSTAHLAAEMLQQYEGIAMRHVPYRGGGSVLMDALGGQMPVVFMAIASVAPYVESKQLTALAVTSAQRSPTLPNVPTVAETLPGFDAVGWYGVLAPADTPPEIVDSLNAEFAKALATEEVKQSFAGAGINLLGGGSDRFTAYLQTEIKKWREVVRKSGARAD